MKIVIDIPEEDFEWNGKLNICRCSFERLIQIVSNGTPLPEHHGRLIDENELIDEIVCEEIEGSYYDVIYAHSVYDAPTIIEADKAESEDKE